MLSLLLPQVSQTSEGAHFPPSESGLISVEALQTALGMGSAIKLVACVQFHRHLHGSVYELGPFEKRMVTQDRLTQVEAEAEAERDKCG